ncbi:hypothetical protein E2C01_012741 [Portunus trituberculatus]|uniref:Uncharacterized protein n=1 Tax=Portunus trituberculatus TaxID=210409 RepID=A0A5B7DEE7_PORTR|nr:hypothetical protein [Portunus trituberculatus]
MEVCHRRSRCCLRAASHRGPPQLSPSPLQPARFRCVDIGSRRRKKGEIRRIRRKEGKKEEEGEEQPSHNTLVTLHIFNILSNI